MEYVLFIYSILVLIVVILMRILIKETDKLIELIQNHNYTSYELIYNAKNLREAQLIALENMKFISEKKELTRDYQSKN